MQYSIAREAHRTNGKLYGSIAALERDVLPELDAGFNEAYEAQFEDDDEGESFGDLLLDTGNWDERMAVAHMDTTAIYGVVDVPVALSGTCSGSFGTAPLDLNSTNLSLG